MELSPSAYVVLGMLGLGPKSGYDIKALADRSTRFFWAASYGQIYPELRRLADAGLIEGKAAAGGGRRRTVHRLTAAGRAELERWLDAPSATQEMRDESLLKVFFSRAAGPAATESALARKAAHHADVAERLRAIRDELGEPEEGSTRLTLRFGIELNEWIERWCETEAARLDAGPARAPKRRRKSDR